MNLFKLFSKPGDNALQKIIGGEDTTSYKNFGRFSDALAEPKQIKLFDEALKKFESKDYIANYILFFQFITNKKEDNVSYTQNSSGINFEIIQGSKKMTGVATVQKFYCISKIAYVDKLQVRYLRQMIEANFAFMYIRYAIDTENNIVLLFESVASEASPYKLLEALRELAIFADKNDDLLLTEFKGDLKPLDLGLRKELPSAIRNFYAHYLIEQIESTTEYLKETPQLDAQYPGGVAYLWLSLAYQLDYLLMPQGFINDTIERIERMFFEKSTESHTIKNKRIAEEFLNIKERPLDLKLDELYQTTCTFSIMSVKSIDALAHLIEGELPNMNWYAKNNYQKIALAVTDFIVGNAQFNNSFPDFERQLLHLYMQIRHFGFFKQLGLTCNLKNNDGSLNAREIKNALQTILVNNNISKKQIETCMASLTCADEVSWARSYLEIITLLND